MIHSTLPAYISTQSAIYHHNKTIRHKTAGPLMCPGIFAVKANKLLASATQYFYPVLSSEAWKLDRTRTLLIVTTTPEDMQLL